MERAIPLVIGAASLWVRGHTSTALACLERSFESLPPAVVERLRECFAAECLRRQEEAAEGAAVQPPSS